ncbi:Ig-like domain-containing protein, partial [Postechiella marina]|uniref:Ig-like domain-containing protein n=1 Tax=Postechiella marina TaxID=943941 RepID=UPI0031D9932F
TATAAQDSPVVCFGEANGSATVTPAGGNGNYTYSWDNGETTATATALNAGTHTVTITDDKDCKTTATVNITQPSAALTASITSVTDVLCNSEATGSIDISVDGGTAPYTFVWNDTNNSTTEDLSNVIADAYNVTITDANGCTTSIGATISEPTSPLSLNITKIDATTAQGCANGEATAIVSGGTSDYTYQWSASAGNVTTATASNLSNGTHSVTITDANNCQLTQSIVIECVNTCDAEITIADVTDVLCTGDDTGAATVTANSEANPSATFTFTWSNGQVDTGVTSSTLSAVNAGVYSVSVTIDGTVCQAVEETVSITEPSNALNITATTTDELGPNTGDGTASSVTTGGVEPYTYSWSPNGETTSNITNLTAGSYSVTVTDANGCTDTTTVTVNPGSCLNLSVTGNSTPAVCFGEENGSVTATVTGGSGNFTYAWDIIPNTTASVSDLPAGDYTITVTDTTTLCTTSTTITINEPNVLSSAIAVSNILCKDDATGSLDLAVNGGTAPYVFAWDNGDTSEDLINVIAGTYNVTITDANGCTTTNSATIIEPDTNVSASITEQTNISCEGLGSITVEGAGGISPYSYSIDGGANYQTTGVFTDLPEDIYTITVIDANGCSITVNTEILINCTDAIADINNTFIDQPVTGNVLTNDEDYEGDAQTVTENTDPANGTVVVNPDGTYTYTPNAGFTGQDSFEYTICDDGNPQACDTATVYIEVLPTSGPGNEAPIANADTATTPEGTPINVPVITNDFDPDGDAITVTETTDPANGTVTLNPDGTITYTPEDGFTGEDTFTYTICDDANPALCDTATVTVTVQPTDAPNSTNAND